MAGNIVKWWKHKILGGYKQFSVLQECTTDSEELIYPTRAPSSCSAPPDLLLISDRETTSQLTKSPNIITSQGDHLREQLVNLTPKVDNTENNHHSNIAAETQIRDKNHENAERMRLEEFTCDVTCESGKSSQPLQFSFTFYDLDGHHGKITKDDIAGIVYTIYESIGKSVVVPHCGSKTINVRLTVSPESKSTGKAKKISGASLAAQSRRQHRYRPRKLIKSDNEECEAESGGSDKETPNNLSKRGPTTSKCHKPNVEADINQKDCCFDPRVSGEHQQSPSNTATTTAAVTIATSHTIVGQPSNSGKSPAHQSVIATVAGCKFPATENVYESVGNLKCCSKDYRKTEALECKECAQQNSILNTQQQQQQIKHSARAAKLLRKARKQKYQDQCHESRQRSLSVGNESCWKSGTKRTSQGDDGGHKGPSTECWNNALKRNDLIDIIRESMEKNRLCFQSNGKTANNESPIRHRHRSHTVSKVTDENYPPGPQTSHHIPIYHQQLAINPAIMTHNNALHPKANLCGYDSFLHATICSANNSPSSVLVPSQSTIKSPKNCVNSANLTKSSKLPKTGYHSQQNSPQFHGYQRLSANHGYPKLNTTLLNSLNPQLSAEEKLNRTIDHVEKWLNERDQTIIKANDVKLLKYGRDEGKIRKDEKNYDNFLHSKLAEKLGESPRKLNNNQNSNKHLANNRDATQNHVHNYHLKQRLIHSPTSHSDRGNTSTSKFVTLIPVNVDPIECENLIHTTTSDEENISPKSANGNITVNSDGCGSAASGSVGEGGGGGNGGGESCASNQGNNSNSSSMVHHYVHEHIHHHYHHFENKED